MKVHYTGNDNLGENRTQGADSLRTGVEYQVLEIYSQADGPNFLRIESIPGQLPGLFDSRLFEVSESEVPGTWEIFIGDAGGITLCPAHWEKRGFWEDLMDGDNSAVSCYQREKLKIEQG